MKSAALLLVALALAGCETTAERSATLERQAKRERAAHPTVAQKGLSITRQSPDVKVLATTVVHSSEGTAAIVTLRSLASRTLHDIPIAITARNASGMPVYTNSAPGLAQSLVSAPLLPAHGELTWVDDQVLGTGRATSVTARIGEAPPTTAPVPRLTVQEARLTGGASGPSVEGTLVNHSEVSQQELVVYAVARRGAQIVAAGRAVLPLARSGGSTPFQIFFIGDPSGAQLTLSAPPTTLG